MKSKVFFHDARANSKRNRLDKIKDLFKRAELSQTIAPGDLVAIKIHWGEPGNVGFIPPPYVRAVVDLVRQAGGVPFVTDANTLYTGMRRNAPNNLTAAAMNGFSQLTIGAPLVVADGIKGRDFRQIELKGTLVQKAKIAAAIVDADAMIVLSHVKGHMLLGFGGAIKNMGMGCAIPADKQTLHSDLRPKVDPQRCKGDGICVHRCPEQCIALEQNQSPGASRQRVARINTEQCIGCGECTACCPHEAIPIRWKTSAQAIQKKTAEYALAAVHGKTGKVGFINFLIQITPDCDCCGWNDTAFVPDVGFLASIDPVAIDAASVELVRNMAVSPASKAEGKTGDPWKTVYDVDYEIILDHGTSIGLGNRNFEMIKL